MEILELLFHLVAELALPLIEFFFGALLECGGELLELVFHIVEALWRDRNKD